MSRVRKGVRADRVRVGDELADGATVKDIESDRPDLGHVRMRLGDDRTFIAPNHYLVEVRRETGKGTS